MAHPDLVVKVWGFVASVPGGHLRRYYEPAVEAFLEAGVAVEGDGLAGASRSPRSIRPACFLEDGRRCRVARSRCRRTRTCRSTSASPLRRGAGAALRRRRHRTVRVRAAPAAAGADPLIFHRTRGGQSTRSRRAAVDLGGIDIPHEEGLDGHSDADVLTHAIIDALLGARRGWGHRAALPGH